MSKLLQQYNKTISAVTASAKRDGMYVVQRWHARNYFELEHKAGRTYKARTDSDVGVGMCVFTKSGHLAFGSTNDVSHESVLSQYKSLAKIAQANQTAGAATAPEIYELEMQPNLGENSLHYRAIDPGHTTITLVEQQLEKLHNHMMELDQAINALIRFNTESDIWRIVRSDDTDVDWCTPKARLNLQLTITKDGKTGSTYLRAIHPTVDQLLGNIESFIKDLDASYHMLVEQISAEQLESGSYPLVLDSTLVGMIAHEALGHPAESDLVANGGSVLGDDTNQYKIGSTVASTSVTVSDHEPGMSHGFHPYGAFGNARQSVTIINNGKLEESISDVFSAAKIGVANKNCERAEGYWAVAIPRMSKTFVDVADAKPAGQELASDGTRVIDPRHVQSALLKLRSFDRHPTVYFLQQMTGGQVSPVVGSFMFGTGFAYRISANTIEPLQPVTFSGNVLGALKSISLGVGEICFEAGGYCGKAGQVAHVTDGGTQLIFVEPTSEVTLS